jgi:pimeloyl-ACP methyl ester carboxylesterase
MFPVMSDAGHWVHAEKPKELENAIRKFLAN